MAKDTTDTATEPVTTDILTPLYLGLVWLGTTMYTVHATITGSGETVSGVLGAAAAALPGVVAATLVTGASIGAAAGPRFRSVGGRLLAGLALGALFGLAAAVGIRLAYGDGAYGDGASIMVLAITVGAASVVGGALAVLPGEVLKAGLWGATWVFLAGVMFGVLQPSLVRLLGSDEAANTRFVLGQSLVTGLAAALYTLQFLRAQRNRVLWYLVGGALPGLVLLGAEWLTRTGGSAVAQLVHGFRTQSPALVELSDSARLRHALIVLAVGGLLATLVGALKSLRSWLGRGHKRASVGAFHQGLARIGLDAGQRYGFALAGGYAVQAAGFLKRPTKDIDLFTAWERRDEFDTAARAIIDAYLAAGLSVQAERRHDTFTRLTVSDGVQTAKVELGVDLRRNEPVRTSIGPVLHPDDAAANKIRALYERAHASDFIDIDAALRSGRYDRSTLLQLGERSDITFDRSVFADALAQAQLLDADDFARYGLVGADLDSLRHRFALWRAELLGAAGPTRTQ
ncbi:MAG TPA: nucleotidyl transferase AbiEii/AbiGii toxin family protein [Candidatus Limnocylindrales bacterium]|nr:nucleotidyl transferase AbiEii/AbiGii toxin family protein [Candidatus Limnocylindrales bacterium]